MDSGGIGLEKKKSGTGRPARPERPRIRASHSGTTTDAGGAGARANGRASKNATTSAAGKKPTAKRLDTKKRPPPPKRADPAESTRKPLAAPVRRASRRATVPPAEASAEARQLAMAIASAGLEKKAIGVEILEVAGKVDYADFLVIMTGRSDRHVQSIASGIEDDLRRRKMRPMSTEGMTTATWVLIDFGDVVVHVFQEDARRVYDIEGLWIDADRVEVPPDDGAAPSPH
jgi:ribosome-associated protein